MIQINTNRKFGLFLMACMLVIATSCRVSNETAYSNLAGNYRNEVSLLLEGMRAFHISDSATRIYVAYNTAGFKYLKPKGKDYFRADYSLSYQLFSASEGKSIIAQGTFLKTDSLHYNNPELIRFNFTVPADFPGTYLLEIRLSDLNANSSVLYPMLLEKEEHIGAQYFLPVDGYGDALLHDWLSWKTKFKITCSDSSINKLFADHYNRDFPAAAPPFSQSGPPVYRAEANENFTVEIRNGSSDYLQFAKEGFFHFKSSENENPGLTIFRFHDHFPQVKNPEQLVPPLRYLTSRREFEELIAAEDAKQAVDNFWISIAGNENLAVELIRSYYGRVEQANKLFTSFKEGWKTDRGMIYIIFGEPKTVYKREDIETWIYGDQGNRVFLTFDFIRAINPFTQNDYELQRNPDFKEQWYNAVLFWRQ
jgi:GWxTD domain-containing protein